MNETVQPRFFGRRKGRTIRKAKSFLLQNFLPQIKIDDTKILNKQTLFGDNIDEIHLEIGFGDGEHLAELARRHKNIGFVGVEVFQNGIANLLTLITGVKEAADTNMSIAVSEGRADNIRVYDDDMRLLFGVIPDGFFDKIYLLFPDPWPKKKHADRRFVNQDNLKELSRILKPGGILEMATDHSVYKRQILRQMHQCPDFVWTAKTSNDWRLEPQDWVKTKYQRKAIREGRHPVFFEYVKL